MKRFFRINRLFPLLAVAIMLLGIGNWRCSPGDSNGSGVGNGMICGKVYAPDGQTPAKGAIVSIWDRNTLASITSYRLKKVNTVTYTTETNANGEFIIQTIDTGLYTMEAIDDQENMVRVDWISIQSPDTRLNLPPDTLKAPGAIKGSIALDAGGDPMEVFILCFGNDRYRQVGGDGTFLLSPLAEGEYTLKVLPLIAHYGSLDTGIITVKSGDTVDLGVITLSVDEIPAVGGLRMEYDSLLQVMTLMWKATPASITKGYNLYRRGADAADLGPPLNGQALIHDTVFVDSTAHRDSTYVYRVAAVDSNDNVGPMSGGAVSTVFSADLIMDTIQLSGIGNHNMYNFIESKNPDYVGIINFHADESCSASCPGLTNVEKYSVAGGLIRSWRLPDRCAFLITAMVLDKTDNVYYAVRDEVQDMICCFDAGGVDRIVLSLPLNTLLDFDVFDNSIVYVTGDIGYPLYGEETCRVTKYLFSEDSVDFSSEWTLESGWNYSGVSFTSRGDIQLLLTTEKGKNSIWHGDTVVEYPDLHVLVLSKSGVETASFNLPTAGPENIQFSDSVYMKKNYQFDKDGKSIFCLYDLSGTQLLNVVDPEMGSSMYLASNGDVYFLTGDYYRDNNCLMRLQYPGNRR